ncbi:hypothetical protein BDU57DRAFT_322333 [Ampelomyces quisqualis]|uniref:Uncharacterized protein n=1 Tax=Ampelomyces quisqualis TaxID=50730 RepID=A0A6A5QH21_AMPQU|nr:hypothetical protein BDU57DRAFT_322333 [Ampelomyces quisqualis]
MLFVGRARASVPGTQALSRASIVKRAGPKGSSRVTPLLRLQPVHTKHVDSWRCVIPYSVGAPKLGPFNRRLDGQPRGTQSSSLPLRSCLSVRSVRAQRRGPRSRKVTLPTVLRRLLLSLSLPLRRIRIATIHTHLDAQQQTRPWIPSNQAIPISNCSPLQRAQPLDRFGTGPEPLRPPHT